MNKGREGGGREGEGGEREVEGGRAIGREVKHGVRREIMEKEGKRREGKQGVEKGGGGSCNR